MRIAIRLCRYIVMACVLGATIAMAIPVQADTPDVIAQGGSVAIDSSDVRSLVAALPVTQRDSAVASVASLDSVLRAEVLRRTLLSEARAQGFDLNAQAAAQLARMREDTLVRLWVENRAAVPPNYPSEDEVKSAYDVYKQALAPTTQYRIAQIFISAPDGLDSIRLNAALKKAADVSARMPTTDFGVLAQQQSEQPDKAASGGDLGYLPENQLLPEVLAAMRDLKPGETAGPVKTSRGLHFLKLLDKKTGAQPTLAEAHERLVAFLRERRARELQQHYLSDLNTKLAVSVNQIELAKLQTALH